jgi:hypothetical protein
MGFQRSGKGRERKSKSLHSFHVWYCDQETTRSDLRKTLLFLVKNNVKIRLSAVMDRRLYCS